MNLFKLFQIDESKQAEHGKLFQRIEELAEQLSETELKEATAVAGLLGRIAYADTEFKDEEVAKIKAILHKESKLSNEAIEVITQLLVEQKIELLTLEEHFYTRLANEVMSADQRFELLAYMFQIAASDGTICLEEENLLHSVAESLKIPKSDVVSLKRTFKNYLSVFQ
ncbi:MAG: TerB family tellurite resistance protein [Deltaproteobacteria bacterium]|nr:TerB family tellurite resistance protein [Deltaproteobacteria bacterium]MBN2672706.1 TerB family tellurite resistance protein [Deltaproteobacteria bacterium]